MHSKTSIVFIGLALVLSGCGSSSQMFGNLPEAVGGLPADAPARPTADYKYPAVHDMPSSRPIEPLSDADQASLKAELGAVRDKQEKAAAEEAQTAPVEVPPNTGQARKP